MTFMTVRTTLGFVTLVTLVTFVTLPSVSAHAQDARPALSESVKRFVSVDAPVVALTHVRLVDGSGQPAKDDQTIVIDGARIRAVGRAADVQVPAGAQVMDLSGHTIMPGIIGLHDHMYYSSPVGGSMRPMLFSYPRLFLATGVTTIRTTGSVDSYQELNLKAAIGKGEIPGPEIHVTGPYLQGQPGQYPAAMHPLKDPEDARRMVRYWAQEGVTWFKAYTTLTRAELGAAIDEAHKNGIKVTAHLCSVGFREAVELGIDNLEHGLLTNTEFYGGKKLDECPNATPSEMYDSLDLSSPDVKKTIDLMVQRKVPMTSTLAVMETMTPSRIPDDPRVLDALHPDAAKAVSEWLTRTRAKGDVLAPASYKKAMQFEKMFYDAGGLLAAGSDPCCISVIAGYGDHRNFEVLVETGFTPEQAIQVMTSNGAKVLGIADRVGTIAPGKQADLIVIKGDVTKTPRDIRNITTVFRQGIGYDSAKLTEAVRGLVGMR
jgi:imidazolonepropionase-like amidohydrolase